MHDVGGQLADFDSHPRQPTNGNAIAWRRARMPRRQVRNCGPSRCSGTMNDTAGDPVPRTTEGDCRRNDVFRQASAARGNVTIKVPRTRPAQRPEGDHMVLRLVRFQWCADEDMSDGRGRGLAREPRGVGQS